MTILVVGATGATGHLLVKQLLERDLKIKAIVRSPDRLSEQVGDHPNLSIIRGSVLDLDDMALAGYVKGCDAVVSCLGHNLTLRGLYGQPRLLVADSLTRLCRAVKANTPAARVKFILMNTAGNRNRDLQEDISFAQRCAVKAIRLLLPPHRDNEDAADYLRSEIGQDDPSIEWVVVRPDNLVDDSDVSRYEIYASPTRSAIFNPGTTSRVNVAHFMAGLITDPSLWEKWKGQMPVIYNKTPNVK